MRLHSLGKITIPAAGTPVQVVDAAGVDSRLVHAIYIEAWPANTGLVWIGNAETLNKTTGAGVIKILGIPPGDDVAGALPDFAVTLSQAPNGLSLGELWLDADDSGDAVIVSYLEG